MRSVVQVGGEELAEPVQMQTIYSDGAEFVCVGNTVHVLCWAYVPVPGPGGQMLTERQIVSRVCMPRSVWARRLADIRQGMDPTLGARPERSAH